MKMKVFLVCILASLSLDLLADPGYFDVFKFKFRGEIYYYSNIQMGQLKPDFCYYNREGTYLYEADFVLNQHINRFDSITVFLEIHKINIKNLIYDNNGDGHIYNFKRKVNISRNDLYNSFVLLEAYNVHSANQIDPLGMLDILDQKRINQNKYEHLFSILGIEAWEYHFYAPIHKYSNKEISKLRIQLVKSQYERSKFNLYMRQMFQEGIVILCDCYE